MMAQRLTWKEIQEKYPDQWVGLVDIVWQDESNIESAIVKYADKSKEELLILQIRALWKMKAPFLLRKRKLHM